MSEKCVHAYRKRNDKSVRCKAIAGEMDYCGHMYFCPVSQRWEANATAPCSLRKKPVVK